MVCIKVYGVPTEKLAVTVKDWMARIARDVIGKRNADKVIVIVIPTPLAATTFRGHQLIEIIYTRPFQQRIKSRLVPYLHSDLVRVRPPNSDETPFAWNPDFVLVPAGEVITQESLYCD